MEVLPLPEGPSRQTNSPGATSKVTPSTAVTTSPEVDRRVLTRSRTASLGTAVTGVRHETQGGVAHGVTGA